MGVSNDDEDGGGVDGDGSRGNSSSRQGARTETSVPRNWSSMAAALWNFSWMDADLFRVFMLEGIYRQKGDVRGRKRGPVWLPPGPPLSLLWTRSSCWEK
jgi:hypothetical protein